MDSSRTSSAVWSRNSSLVAAALSGLTVAVWAAAPTKVLIAFLCLLVSGLIVLVLRALYHLQQEPRQPELLQTMLDLAHDCQLARVHASVAEDLKRISEQKDSVFRQLALPRLQAIAQECHGLGDGKIEFPSTESWRVVYEELLRSPGLYLYRSVAYIESPHYSLNQRPPRGEFWFSHEKHSKSPGVFGISDVQTDNQTPNPGGISSEAPS